MKVVVIGGGVAGPVSAVALRRIGAEVTVVEAYADPGGAIGSFVSLAANGLRSLDRVGCLDRVRRRGFPVARQRMWSGSGALLGDVARGRASTDPLLSVTLTRADLVDELRRAAVDAGATVLTGDSALPPDPALPPDSAFPPDSALPPDSAFPPDPPDPAGPVAVRLSSGRTLVADLVVGADGIWSPTRDVLNPDGPVPRYTGLYVVSGTSRGVDFGPGPLARAGEPGVFNFVFGRAGAFIAVTRPDGDVWWQAQVASPTEPDRGDPGPADPTRLFRGEPLPSAVLAATTRLNRTTVNHGLAPVPVWRSGRIVLIGDAAHPVGAGQGASMAIEDGLVLAHALTGAPTVEEGLARYEAARRPRITRMLKAGDDNRDTKKAGPVRRGLERVMMPIVFRHFYERATGWLYAYDPPALGSSLVDSPGLG